MKNKYFYFFCLAHLIFWTFLQALTYANPPTDSLEGIAWGRLWLLGYPKHPFLAPWIAAFVTEQTGCAAWKIYFLGQLSVIVCFWATWRLASKVLLPLNAFIAIVLLEGIYYYNIGARIFNPNVLMLPLWSLATLAFYYALSQQRTFFWLGVGFFSGLAIICKYESAILLFLFWVILFSTQEGRASFSKPGIYLSTILFILIIFPNLYYLYQHHFDSVKYAISEMSEFPSHPLLKDKLALRLYNPIDFFMCQFLAVLPIFMLSIPFYKLRNPKGFLTSFDHRFFMTLALGPLAVTLLFSLFTNASLIPRWGFPFFSLIGIVWMVYLNPSINRESIKKFFGIFLIFVVLITLGIIKETVFEVYLYHKADIQITNFPGKSLTETVKEKWRELEPSPLQYVIGDYRSSVNIAAFSKNTIIPFFDASLAESPWIDTNDLKKKGGVFIFRLDPKQTPNKIAELKKKYLITNEATFSLYPLTHAKVDNTVRFWIGFLLPLSKIST